MKRTLLFVIAALLVLLSYPSTHSHAGTTKQLNSEKPSIMVKSGGGDDGITLAGTDDDDDGDSDGILGIKGKTRGLPGAPLDGPASGTRTLLKVWWSYLMFLR